jgi:ABC-2 type transport system ATP-binding protein
MQSAFGREVSRSGPTTWKFDTTDPERSKKQILQFTLEKNLNIVSIQSETTNLEDVFRNLTA